jgi:signal recognition particle receptor subunit beta
MDYGELTLEDGQKLRLYGTPGQQRFEYMWQILTRGALGLIILIDNSGSDPIGELVRYIDNFREFISETSAVIGITHMDSTPEPDLQSYYQYLQGRSIELPLLAVDARSADSVVMLIQALLAMLEFS